MTYYRKLLYPYCIYACVWYIISSTTKYLNLHLMFAIILMHECFTVCIYEAILAYRTLRVRSIEHGGDESTVRFRVVYFTTLFVKARTRTSSFRDIDCTAADILARVLARASASTRKCEVPSLPADDRRQSRVKRQKWMTVVPSHFLLCIMARHSAIRRYDRRPEMADISDKCARKRG